MCLCARVIACIRGCACVGVYARMRAHGSDTRGENNLLVRNIHKNSNPQSKTTQLLVLHTLVMVVVVGVSVRASVSI